MIRPRQLNVEPLFCHACRYRVRCAEFVTRSNDFVNVTSSANAGRISFADILKLLPLFPDVDESLQYRYPVAFFANRIDNSRIHLPTPSVTLATSVYVLVATFTADGV